MPRMTDEIAAFHWGNRPPEDIDAYIRSRAGRPGARDDRRLQAALHLRRAAAAPADRPPLALPAMSDAQARFHWPDATPACLRAFVEAHRGDSAPSAATERRLAAALHLLGGPAALRAPAAATPAAPAGRAPARGARPALSYALIANPGNALALAPPLAHLDRILFLAETVDVDTGNTTPGDHPAALEAELAAFGLMRALEWTFEVDPSLDGPAVRAFLAGLGLRDDPRLAALLPRWNA